MDKESFKNFGLKLKKKVAVVYGSELETIVNEDFVTIEKKLTAEDHMNPFSGGNTVFKINRKQKAYWTFSGNNGEKCECLDEAFDLAFKTCKMYKFLKSI